MSPTASCGDAMARLEAVALAFAVAVGFLSGLSPLKRTRKPGLREAPKSSDRTWHHALILIVLSTTKF